MANVEQGEGVVRDTKQSKGCGFIVSGDGEELFFLRKDFFGWTRSGAGIPEIGERVQFLIVQGRPDKLRRRAMGVRRVDG